MMVNMLELALTNNYKPSFLEELSQKKERKVITEMETRMLSTNTSIRLWLMKILQKMGLTGRFTAVSA